MSHNHNKLLTYNLGVSVLKIWLAMSIVVCHFLEAEATLWYSSFFTKYGGSAVPIFVLLSFLLNDVANETSNQKIKHRLYRLILPQCFFSVIYFVIYKIILGKHYDWRDLIYQVVFGANFNSPMWFLTDLIFLSIVFYIIFAFFKGEKGIEKCIFIAGVAIYLQYSGINYKLFCNFPSYAKWTLGRIIELIPIAVIGIILSYYKVIDKLNSHRRIAFLISLIGLLLCEINLFNACKGFYYQGITHVVISLCLVVMFLMIPFDGMPINVKLIINRWSCYNMGIIAMHYMVREFYGVLNNRNFSKLSLMECFLLYSVSLVISIIGSHIPIKFIRNSFT